jgi:hypothetical protein
MGLFISKYDMRKWILEEHQFTDRDITPLYISKQMFDIIKI